MPSIGQLLGRFFGGEAGGNEALLRAYGKLPFYAEYRRLEVAPGAPTAYSRWLDDGRLAWVRSPSKTEQGRTRGTRVLIVPPESKEYIVASIWDGRDSLGRVFPFSFFINCAPEALGADLLEQWISADVIHQHFEQLYRELTVIGQGGDFYKLYGKRTVRLRPEDLADRVAEVRREAAAIPVENWLEQLKLDPPIEPLDWFSDLTRRSRRWKASAAAGELALSCPLAGGYSRIGQMAVWLSWLGGFLPKSGRLVGLLVPSPEVPLPGAACVLARDVIADDFQLLTTDEPAYGFIEHLTARLASPGEGSAVLPVGQPTGSLIDCLSKIPAA